MINPELAVVKEIEEQRPPFPVGLLSHTEKTRLVERGIVGLYRWYIDRSQKTRNWNADKSFDWRNIGTNHSSILHHIVEGFYAVEQYVPDYTSKAITLVRKSYGRSHFQIRWGAEEEKHADLWLNAMLFLRHRTPDWIRDYMHSLRNHVWNLPWDDALHLNCYTVIQERATQLNYLNTAIITDGKSDKPELANDKDDILSQAAKAIAVDEAAHYSFFLEILRLQLYYFPAQTLEALQTVINHFTMPAMSFIPNATDFQESLYQAGVYGPRQYMGGVLSVALKNLGIAGRKALTNGIKRSRQVPDPDGHLRDTSIIDSFDYDSVQQKVKQLFNRIQNYEIEIGLDEIDPTQFVPSGLVPVPTNQ